MATPQRLVRFRTVRELGALIQDTRTERGWTQAELAERAHVGRQWLVSVERGHHGRAEIGMVLHVIEALGVRLFAEQNPEPVPLPPEQDLDAILRRFAPDGR